MAQGAYTVSQSPGGATSPAQVGPDGLLSFVAEVRRQEIVPGTAPLPVTSIPFSPRQVGGGRSVDAVLN